MKFDSSDTLFIRLSKSEILFAHFDEASEGKPAWTSFHAKPDISLNANMHEALAKVALAKGHYASVLITVDSPATLVPLSEFDEDEMDDLYFFNYPTGRRRRRVFYDTLPHLGAILLFSIDKDICHTLLETYPDIRFQSIETALLLHFAASCPQALPQGRMYACLRDKQISIATFRKGQIELYNSYVLHHPEDAVYYTLQASHLWPARPEKDELMIAGEGQAVDTLAETLRTYLPNTSVLRAEEEYDRHPLALQPELPYDFITAILHGY